jgi:Holliday junction resolvase RusA-like endonuclease
MPAPWSQKKRKELDGTPHQQVPDLDNYLKGFLDALCSDDKHIYSIHELKKIWSDTGNIVLTIDNGEVQDMAEIE